MKLIVGRWVAGFMGVSVALIIRRLHRILGDSLKGGLKDVRIWL